MGSRRRQSGVGKITFGLDEVGYGVEKVGFGGAHGTGAGGVVRVERGTRRKVGRVVGLGRGPECEGSEGWRDGKRLGTGVKGSESPPFFREGVRRRILPRSPSRLCSSVRQRGNCRCPGLLGRAKDSPRGVAVRYGLDPEASQGLGGGLRGPVGLDAGLLSRKPAVSWGAQSKALGDHRLPPGAAWDSRGGRVAASGASGGGSRGSAAAVVVVLVVVVVLAVGSSAAVIVTLRPSPSLSLRTRSSGRSRSRLSSLLLPKKDPLA